MYEGQVKLLRYCAEADCTECAVAGCPGPRKLLKDAADSIEELDKFRWNLAAPGNMPDDFGDDVLVTDGEGYAVGFWHEDAKAWDSADFGWLENRSEPPCGIHTVTHWMPLPPLPEPPKEET